MSALPYQGRAPDSDFTVVNKGYVDTRYAAVKVDNAYVNGAVAAEATNLATPSYADAGDATRAHKAAVDAADANYVLVSDKGTSVASTDGSNFIPSGQLGTVTTSRKPVFKAVDTTFLTGVQEVTVVTLKGFKVATMTIADPGYPYAVLPFAMIQGGSVNGTQSANGLGTGNYAQVSILRSSDDAKFGWSVTTGQKQLDFHLITPYATTGSAQQALTGSLQLDMWVGLYGGTTYTFNPTGLQFWALVYPAV